MKLKWILGALVIFLAAATYMNAAVYQWEWVDPDDHSLGKKQGSVLIHPTDISASRIAARNWTKAYLPGANLFNADGDYVVFSDAYLVNSNFESASITRSTFINADLEGANLRRTNLSQTDFSGANFTNADLTGAAFNGGQLYGANFTGAHIQDVGLWGRTRYGLTAAMIYSTASYQEHNLTGVYLGSNDLSGWDLSFQNLTNAWIGSGNLSGLKLRGSDLRGAAELYLEELDVANTTNAILLDGRVRGLNLSEGEQLRIWDYDGYAGIPVDGVPAKPPFPIKIEQQMTMAADSSLKMLFEPDGWNSTISFAHGISASLDGELELTFAPGIEPSTQIGRTFDLFDWTGVTPTGAFNVVSPYEWDLSNLYTTGEVTLLGAGLAAGDFDGDGDVDGLDFVVWQTNFPISSGATRAQGDADGDGDVDGADFVVWQTSFTFTPTPVASPVPEPPTIFGLASAAMAVAFTRRTRNG